MQLHVLQPYVSIRHQIRVRQLCQELDLDENLLQPGMVVSDWDSLAGKVPQVAAIYLVANQEDHAFATPAKLLLLHEERLEIVGAEGFPSNSTTVRDGRRRAGDKVCIAKTKRIGRGMG
jgi:hypothetical protein